MLGSCNSLGLIEAICGDLKWSPSCQYMYSKCKRSSLCQDQINLINQSFRSPPHPFRSLELHFQTILQGPCMPDSMYHSPVAVSLKNTIWGWEFYSGPCTIQQCEELFHQRLQEMGCNQEVMSVYSADFFTSAKTVRTAIVLDNSKGLCLETTSRCTRGYQQCN